MFSKIQEIQMDISPSALLDNLTLTTSNSKVQLAYISAKIINNSSIVDMKTVTHKKIKIKDSVEQVKYVQLDGATVIVVVGGKNLQIFDASTDLLLAESDILRKYDDDQLGNHARGIAVVKNSLICIAIYTGYLNGIVTALHCQRTKELTFKDLNPHHHAEIRDMCDMDNKLIAVDKYGSIIIWNCCENRLELLTKYETTNLKAYPQCIQTLKQILAIGTSNGKLFVFKYCGENKPAFEESKKICISAHVRAITAMDVEHISQTLASVSEDSVIRLWRFQLDDRVPIVVPLWCFRTADCLLYGIQFLNQDNFFVSAYDKNVVLAFKKDM